MALKPGSAAAGSSGLKVSERLLENDAISVRFDEKGRIVSLFDKKIGRDLIVPGTLSNRLQAYRDMPVEYDAWDIDESFEDQVWDIDELVSARVVETGPYRAAIRSADSAVR